MTVLVLCKHLTWLFWGSCMWYRAQGCLWRQGLPCTCLAFNQLESVSGTAAVEAVDVTAVVTVVITVAVTAVVTIAPDAGCSQSMAAC